jgi:glycosyltransferase involved in cell wall biosynthesis
MSSTVALPDRPRISVIVPHFRDLAGLDRCLTALSRQTLPKTSFEIIVADNNSPEGEARVAEVIGGRARLTVVKEKGAGSARNGGVAVAVGDILAFTDADCVPDPAWLAEGVRALDAWDFVGGAMTVLVDDPARMTPEEAFETVYAFHNEDYVNRRGFTVSANLFCRREHFATVGGFVGAGIAEDCEWCYRARDLGFTLGYADASIVGHPARRTWEDLLKKWRRANSDLFGLTVMQRWGRGMWALRCIALIPAAVIQAPRALFDGNIKAIGQRVNAIGVLFRLRFWRLGDSLRLLFAARPA